MTEQQRKRMINALRKAISCYGERKYVFADALGVNSSLINHWLSGRAKISLRLACKIEDLVDGYVTVNELAPCLPDKIKRKQFG